MFRVTYVIGGSVSLLHPGSKKEEEFIEYLKRKYAKRCSEKDKTN